MVIILQKELCAATQALAQHLRIYEMQVIWTNCFQFICQHILIKLNLWWSVIEFLSVIPRCNSDLPEHQIYAKKKKKIYMNLISNIIWSGIGFSCRADCFKAVMLIIKECSMQRMIHDCWCWVIVIYFNSVVY